MSSNSISGSTSPSRWRRLAEPALESPRGAPASWSRAQRVLHWTIAVLVAVGAAVAATMVRLPFEQLLAKFLLYQLHKTVGVTVFLLACAQLILHLRRGRPGWDSDLPPWRRRAAAAAHVALFALLVVTPIFGYMTAATAPARVPTLFLLVIPIPHVVGADKFWFSLLRPVHLTLALVLLTLASVHALAALNHHRTGRRILARMWRG